MTRLHDWSPSDEPGAVVDVSTEAGWDEIRNFYCPVESFPSTGGAIHPVHRCAPLERVIEIAREHGVASVLVEYRYIDLDYRSEHSRFYSTTFRRYPSVTHRLHFFTERVLDDLSNLAELQGSYRGYSIMRPLPGHPVGRTMLAPPPDLAENGVVCLAKDRAHVFGVSFEVEAMPFVSQDAQYLRCAHAAQWMVLHHSHLTKHTPRRLPADIHDASSGGVVVGRQVPSGGLSFEQLLAGLHALGTAADGIRLPADKAEDARRPTHLRLHAVICRYVNSETPPIVISDQHAWVVVGYRQRNRTDFDLYRHDDALGPYIKVSDPFSEPHAAHHPWRFAIPPLALKCYVAGERAEPHGRFWLSYLAAELQDNALAHARAAQNLTFRSYAVEGHRFKSGAVGRHGTELSDAYARMHLPRYVWVVEALDRDALLAGRPAVLGEALIDATADHEVEEDAFPFPTVLSLHAGGFMISRTLDFEEPLVVRTSDFRPYETFGVPNRRDPGT